MSIKNARRSWNEQLLWYEENKTQEILRKTISFQGSKSKNKKMNDFTDVGKISGTTVIEITF